jgi:hypothetical protein
MIKADPPTPPYLSSRSLIPEGVIPCPPIPLIGATGVGADSFYDTFPLSLAAAWDLPL